jgi:hypothetical protein
MFRLLMVLLVSLLAGPVDALACSCLPPDVTWSYNNHDHAIFGRVQSVQTRAGYRIYDVLIRKTLKSCLTEGTVVQVATPGSSAACGAYLQVNSSYVLFASDSVIRGATRLLTTSCSGNIEVGQLTADERDFLMSREVCCGGSCECTDGTQPYNCLVDPCTVTPMCSAADTCVANYCGGCVAEQYDANGYGVCMPW